MLLLSAAAAMLMAAAATEMPAVVVEAPDSPVKISRATVLTVPGDPPVLLYAATNQTDNDLEQFTVTVFRDRRQIAKSWSTLVSTPDAAASCVSRRTTRLPSSNGSRLYSSSPTSSMPTTPMVMAAASERPPMIVSAGYFSSMRVPSFQSSQETDIALLYIIKFSVKKTTVVAGPKDPPYVLGVHYTDGGGPMILLGVVMAGLLAAVEMPAIVVQAADSPVKISRATVLTVPGDPPVLLYAATNQTDNVFEQFTVMVFFFDAKGTLKTEQIAPGRRTLEARSTKYSTIVLDAGPVDPAGSIVVGVNQVQRVNSEAWWRADLRAAAEAAVPRVKP